VLSDKKVSIIETFLYSWHIISKIVQLWTKVPFFSDSRFFSQTLRLCFANEPVGALAGKRTS